MYALIENRWNGTSRVVGETNDIAQAGEWCEQMEQQEEILHAEAGYPDDWQCNTYGVIPTTDPAYERAEKQAS